MSSIVDLTGESPAKNVAGANLVNIENETDDESEELKLIQLLRIEATIVGKRFYKEKLNDGELVYLGKHCK